MRYRQLGRTGLSVGEIGMGCEGFLDRPYEQVCEYVDIMEQAGANLIDLYAPNPTFRSDLGRALEGRRDRFILQAHLCTVWKHGQYQRTRDIREVKESFESQLKRCARLRRDRDDPLCGFPGGLGVDSHRPRSGVCQAAAPGWKDPSYRIVQPQSGSSSGCGQQRVH